MYEKEWASWLVAMTGIKAKTKYDKDSSSSTDRKAKNTMQDYGYKKVKKYSGDNACPQAKAQLRKGLPVFYGGRTKRVGGNGHNWVVDGLWHMYDKKNSKNKMELMHVNFGWGGKHNGWYQNGVFNSSKSMVSYDPSVGDSYNKKFGRDYKRHIKILVYNKP